MKPKPACEMCDDTGIIEQSWMGTDNMDIMGETMACDDCEAWRKVDPKRFRTF